MFSLVKERVTLPSYDTLHGTVCNRKELMNILKNVASVKFYLIQVLMQLNRELIIENACGVDR